MPNGTFSSTLDFNFIGGGVLVVSGGLPLSSYDFELDFAGVVPVVGTIEPITLDFLLDAGVAAPTIYATADLSIGFTQTGFIEFGIQSYLSSGNNAIDWSVDSTGFVTVSGSFDNTFDIDFSGTMTPFSLGDSTGSYAFVLDARALNYSEFNKSYDGKNLASIHDNIENSITMLEIQNHVKIIDSGQTGVKILQK
jgi:hypothetical protein